MRIPLLLLSFLLAAPAVASTYVVNDLSDASDSTPGNDVCATAGLVCTLRAAMEEANAHAGADSITFSVAGTITPLTDLPALTEEVEINALGAPGYAGTPVVQVAGAGARNVGFNFDIGSTASQLLGLKVHGFASAGVSIASSNVIISRNHLGPVGSGTANLNGLILAAGSSGSTIGGSTNGLGNVISGNTADGIIVRGSDHTIADNYIGTTDAAATAQPNGDDGIFIDAATSITIGGAAGAENVVSGNGSDGVENNGGTTITLAGNFIGTDGTGTFQIGNALAGVRVVIPFFGVQSIAIGTATLRNVISGNVYGIYIPLSLLSPSTTTIVNNYIGLNAAGTAQIPNTSHGIHDEQGGAIIGTATTGNVISGNLGAGIMVGYSISAPATLIRNNIIGLGPDGVTLLGNNAFGIQLNALAQVGGTGAGEGNTISANGLSGIICFICNGSTIYGNTIGLNEAGDTARGNGHDGINVGEPTGGNLTIGAVGTGANVISGNFRNGVFLDGNGTPTTVVGNRIGTDVSGAFAIGNLGAGVRIDNAGNNSVLSNVVSGNAAHGVHIQDGGQHVLYRNIIGRNAANNAALPNTLDGVLIDGFSSTNTIGSPALGEGNVIASNGGTGVGVLLSASIDNVIVGNSIFGNAELGIDLRVDGPTSNDPLDPDSGPNGVQNFPLIASALSTGSASSIQGTLNSTPNTSFDLHFYSNTVADPTGFGEGEAYLGVTSVMTDASGNVSFTWPGPALALGALVSATATGPSGTSEFSAVNDVVAAPTFRFSASTYSTLESAGTVTITVVRQGDLGETSTVVYATSDGTASTGSDYATSGGTLTFGAGVASATFDIPIVADLIDEPTEQFNLTLSDPTAATLTAPSTAVVQIEDPFANLSLTKTTAGTYVAGQNVTFTITVTNAGPDTAPNVVVTDVLPPGSTFVSATPSTGTCSGTITVVCNMPTLASGATATIALVVNASTPAISNTATVTSDAIDVDPANNIATANAASGAIPTASTWGLIALMSLLAAVAVLRMR